MTSNTLRVAVVGAGMMGADHIARFSSKINGAEVVAVVEPDAARAAAAVKGLSAATTRSRIEDALEHDELDAVLIATPGPYHEAVLLPALEAGVQILCEKPLTPDTASSLRIIEAEQKLDRPHIQLGFMRRFDAEYVALRELIASGDAGGLTMLHCAHRNPSTGEGYTDSMLITDSVVHEIDTIPWLVGEPIAAVEVKKARRNSLAPAWLHDPQLVLFETVTGVLADVEINVNVQFGYQVTTEAVFERGIAEIGKTAGLVRFQDARWGGTEHVTFKTRFAAAYDSQVQRWVDAARTGTIDGPSAWDGYVAAAVSEAAVAAQASGERVTVEYAMAKPAFYN
ncbi:Gfo/Idh/MocA family protein [Agreia sp. COWG]|uniref:Gfo/Idh/MocA family protein n=1 Tax=Agreia sp. COWG TaxID=2773266 RepID=UPI0019254A4C|nr:Gfo/Idh/MocA family oxidoreductase [Agreia sp. COWG]CAD5989721.1 Inositol 2-dehydrogenase [Agreia sp. COWG]